MNPYEADPCKIPSNDPYSDLPFYGRYHLEPDDFKPLAEHYNSYTPESIAHWRKILDKCDSTKYVYPNPFGGRSVFALGSTIVKSSHLQVENINSNCESARDHSIADPNEIAAINLVPKGVSTASILFADKIDGHDILVQLRLPGVALNVAWPYLSLEQKASLQSQTRDVLCRLKTVCAPSTITTPGFIVPDPDPVSNRSMDSQECEMLFGESSKDETLDSNTKLYLMHNDLQPSNIIVKDDKIIDVVDREHAGWFRWKDVGLIHSQYRIPTREQYTKTDLSETQLDDLIFWSDLYEFQP